MWKQPLCIGRPAAGSQLCPAVLPCTEATLTVTRGSQLVQGAFEAVKTRALLRSGSRGQQVVVNLCTAQHLRLLLLLLLLLLLFLHFNNFLAGRRLQATRCSQRPHAQPRAAPQHAGQVLLRSQCALLSAETGCAATPDATLPSSAATLAPLTSAAALLADTTGSGSGPQSSSVSLSSQDIRLAQSFLRPFLLRGGVGERELLRPRPRPPAAGLAVVRAAAIAAFCGRAGREGVEW